MAELHSPIKPSLNLIYSLKEIFAWNLFSRWRYKRACSRNDTPNLFCIPLESPRSILDVSISRRAKKSRREACKSVAVLRVIVAHRILHTILLQTCRVTHFRSNSSIGRLKAYEKIQFLEDTSAKFLPKKSSEYNRA